MEIKSDKIERGIVLLWEKTKKTWRDLNWEPLEAGKSYLIWRRLRIVYEYQCRSPTRVNKSETYQILIIILTHQIISDFDILIKIRQWLLSFKETWELQTSTSFLSRNICLPKNWIVFQTCQSKRFRCILYLLTLLVNNVILGNVYASTLLKDYVKVY